MSGHLFVIRGDLRTLACDAWLLPGGRHAKVSSHKLPADYPGPWQGTPFDRQGPRTQMLPPVAENQPRIWLTNVGGSAEREIGWYVEGALEFLRAAREELVRSGRAPLHRRAKPLLALPLIGTGKGGAAQRAGAVLQQLLPTLLEFARATDVDVALVDLEPAKHAAAQAVRQRLDCWPEVLSEGLQQQAEFLAREAREGRLALFLGAGIGVPAGLPTWHELLRQMAARAGLDLTEQEALKQMGSVLDQASVLERRLQRRGEAIGEAVAEIIGQAKRKALTHMLLAALPVQEVVTTNYDELFDSAWRDHSAEPTSVLPEQIVPATRRWLLKMHGSVKTPERIVLTRFSYTRYDERLPTLAGLVQAVLITRHMLFVGFSLKDDNFHRIVDAVRRVHGETEGERLLATTLSLGRGGLAEQLWEEDLRRVSMLETLEDKAFPYPEAGRRLEIFLDYLSFRTRATMHLLAGQPFDDVLSPGERQVRDALTAFWELLSAGDGSVPAWVPAEVRQTAAWPEIERLLLRLGFQVDK